MLTKIIARNSFWYGLETLFSTAVGVLTSIAIARTLGPDQLGPFVYIGWLLSVAISLGGLGVPTATCKYMALYLGRGDLATARAVFFFTLTIQLTAGAILTITAVCLVYYVVPNSQRVFALLLALGCFPAMINAIPAQANAASENLAANVPASFISTLIYTIGVTASLLCGWGVNGLAGSVLAMLCTNMSVRLIPAVRRIRRFPVGSVPIALRSQIIRFSRQNLILLLLSVIVWDRSEMLFLQYLATPRQLAFYSVVFNITERLRLLPDIFSMALRPSIMAQLGRDPVRLNPMVTSALRYLVLLVAPLGVGLALLSGPLMEVIYGMRYLEAATLLSVASLLAIPRALLGPLNVLISTTENQHLTIRWGVVFALVNIVLDVWLIRRYAAMGAVVANGLTQTAMTVALFVHATRRLKIRFPVMHCVKIAFCTFVMALAVRAVVGLHLYLSLTIALGFFLGGLIFLIMIRFTNSIQAEDQARFTQIQTRLPTLLQPLMSHVAGLLAPTS